LDESSGEMVPKVRSHVNLKFQHVKESPLDDTSSSLDIWPQSDLDLKRVQCQLALQRLFKCPAVLRPVSKPGSNPVSLSNLQDALNDGKRVITSLLADLKSTGYKSFIPAPNSDVPDVIFQTSEAGSTPVTPDKSAKTVSRTQRLDSSKSKHSSSHKADSSRTTLPKPTSPPKGVKRTAKELIRSPIKERDSPLKRALKRVSGESVKALTLDDPGTKDKVDNPPTAVQLVTSTPKSADKTAPQLAQTPGLFQSLFQKPLTPFKEPAEKKSQPIADDFDVTGAAALSSVGIYLSTSTDSINEDEPEENADKPVETADSADKERQPESNMHQIGDDQLIARTLQHSIQTEAEERQRRETNAQQGDQTSDHEQDQNENEDHIGDEPEEDPYFDLRNGQGEREFPNTHPDLVLKITEEEIDEMFVPSFLTMGVRPIPPIPESAMDKIDIHISKGRRIYRLKSTFNPFALPLSELEIKELDLKGNGPRIYGRVQELDSTRDIFVGCPIDHNSLMLAELLGLLNRGSMKHVIVEAGAYLRIYYQAYIYGKWYHGDNIASRSHGAPPPRPFQPDDQ
jgi:hypothetical protein